MDAINASGANQGPGGADGDRGEVLSIMTWNINCLVGARGNRECVGSGSRCAGVTANLRGYEGVWLTAWACALSTPKPPPAFSRPS